LGNSLFKGKTYTLGGWSPDTLADETRQIIGRTFGMPSIEEGLEKMPDDLAMSVDLSIDHFYHQKNYCERPQQIYGCRQIGYLSEKCRQENFFLRGEKMTRWCLFFFLTGGGSFYFKRVK